MLQAIASGVSSRMLCKPLNCIFVHIPKVAGQSIEARLLECVDPYRARLDDFLLRVNTDPARGPVVLDHLSAKEYVGCGYISAAEFDSLFKFGFVRNPWDRLVSEYRYREYQLSFEFKRFVLEHWPKAGFNDLHLHVIPQYDFLHDDDGRLLVDYVGKYERLQEHFDTVSNRLGIPQRTLPRRNISSSRSWDIKAVKRILRKPRHELRLRRGTRRNYWEYYDTETEAFVREYYRNDVDTFGYVFGE